MSKKRFVFLAICSVLIVSIFTGCGTSKPNEKEKGNIESGTEQGDSGEVAVDYPNKPVQVIIPFAPGGGSDILTRAIMKYIELPEALVAVNIEGASGLIGAEEGYRAKPDGYTILQHNPLDLASYTMSGATKEAIWDEMETICFIVDDYTVVSTNKETGWKNIDDMIEYAKENPGQIKWGVTGAQTTNMADSLRAKNGMDLDTVMVPYEGGAASRTALLGNHIQLETSTSSDIYSSVESGDIVPLFVIAPNRAEALPDVPTLLELGIEVDSGKPRAYYIPKGTPQEIIDILADAFKGVAENPEFIEYVKDLGLEVKYVDGKQGAETLSKWVEGLQPVFDEMKTQAE